MLFWFIYISSCVLISYILSTIFSHKLRVFIFCLVFTLLATPENLGIGQDQEKSPAFFSFIFTVIFERDYSFLVLRPLVLTLPLATIISILSEVFRKKLFQN